MLHQILGSTTDCAADFAGTAQVGNDSLYV